MRGALNRLWNSFGRGKRFNVAVGRAGERIAERHLHRRGHRILARNWRSPRGEIDVISALRDGTIVFTEVKTRRALDHGAPLEAVDEVKRGRLMRAAQDYLRHWGIENRPLRFDLIGIEWLEEDSAPRIEHVEGIE